MEKLTLNINEVAAALGISRNAAYQACKKGEIPAIRIGKRLLVPKNQLERMLDGVPKEG